MWMSNWIGLRNEKINENARLPSCDKSHLFTTLIGKKYVDFFAAFFNFYFFAEITTKTFLNWFSIAYLSKLCFIIYSIWKVAKIMMKKLRRQMVNKQLHFFFPVELKYVCDSFLSFISFTSWSSFIEMARSRHESSDSDTRINRRRRNLTTRAKSPIR